MARTDNLSNYLKDVADAIRAKKETTEEIPAEQFDTEILNIQTGTDTSDATATPGDIFYPETAYISSGKTVGNVQANYEDIDSDAKGTQYTVSNLPSSYASNIGIVSQANLIIFHNHKDILIYKYNNDFTNFELLQTINLVENYSNYNQIITYTMSSIPDENGRIYIFVSTYSASGVSSSSKISGKIHCIVYNTIENIVEYKLETDTRTDDLSSSYSRTNSVNFDMINEFPNTVKVGTTNLDSYNSSRACLFLLRFNKSTNKLEKKGSTYGSLYGTSSDGINYSGTSCISSAASMYRNIMNLKNFTITSLSYLTDYIYYAPSGKKFACWYSDSQILCLDGSVYSITRLSSSSNKVIEPDFNIGMTFELGTNAKIYHFKESSMFIINDVDNNRIILKTVDMTNNITLKEELYSYLYSTGVFRNTDDGIYNICADKINKFELSAGKKLISFTRNGINYYNVQDTTATKDDIFDGKTAYCDGKKISGNILTDYGELSEETQVDNHVMFTNFNCDKIYDISYEHKIAAIHKKSESDKKAYIVKWTNYLEDAEIIYTIDLISDNDNRGSMQICFDKISSGDFVNFGILLNSLNTSSNAMFYYFIYDIVNNTYIQKSQNLNFSVSGGGSYKFLYGKIIASNVTPSKFYAYLIQQKGSSYYMNRMTFTYIGNNISMGEYTTSASYNPNIDNSIRILYLAVSNTEPEHTFCKISGGLTFYDESYLNSSIAGKSLTFYNNTDYILSRDNNVYDYVANPIKSLTVGNMILSTSNFYNTIKYSDDIYVLYDSTNKRFVKRTTFNDIVNEEVISNSTNPIQIPFDGGVLLDVTNTINILEPIEERKITGFTRKGIKYYDTKDTTATSDDIFDNLTAYCDGKKISGSIQTDYEYGVADSVIDTYDIPNIGPNSNYEAANMTEDKIFDICERHKLLLRRINEKTFNVERYTDYNDLSNTEVLWTHSYTDSSNYYPADAKFAKNDADGKVNIMYVALYGALVEAVGQIGCRYLQYDIANGTVELITQKNQTGDGYIGALSADPTSSNTFALFTNNDVQYESTNELYLYKLTCSASDVTIQSVKVGEITENNSEQSHTCEWSNDGAHILLYFINSTTNHLYTYVYNSDLTHLHSSELYNKVWWYDNTSLIDTTGKILDINTFNVTTTLDLPIAATENTLLPSIYHYKDTSMFIIADTANSRMIECTIDTETNTVSRDVVSSAPYATCNGIITDGSIVFASNNKLYRFSLGDNRKLVGFTRKGIQYSNISAETDLIPENIKSGVDLFGVVGTYTGDLIVLPNGIKFKESSFENIDFISDCDISNITDMSEMFSSCGNLTSMVNIDMSNVTNAYAMFNSCENLVDVHISNTNNLTNVTYMFQNCKNMITSPEIISTNFTKITNMFNGCTNLTTISEFDIANVTDMYHAFNSCPNLSDESLNIILNMCSNSNQALKTLAQIGLSEQQANKCTTLSNWSACENNGWTTGY